MKKLLIHLLPAVLLNTFISAASGNCNRLIKASPLNTIEVAGGSNTKVNGKAELEIHPLDILSIKFN